MSVRSTSPRLSGLSSADGELVSVQIAVNPKVLEDILECLAELSFPVNPQILHGVPTIIEFPAWENQLSELNSTVRANGFSLDIVSVRSMLDVIAAHA